MNNILTRRAENRLEGGDRGRSRLQYRALHWLEKDQLAEQATIESNYLFEGINYSFRFSKHASRSLAWTTSVIPLASWRAPARQEVAREELHELILVEDST